MEIEQRYEKRYTNFAAREILGQFQFGFIEASWKIGLGGEVATGEGFEYSVQIHRWPGAALDMTEVLSRIGT